MSTNGMRAHNQDRRAIKKKIRQEQAQKPSGAVDPREPQTTLDGHELILPSTVTTTAEPSIRGCKTLLDLARLGKDSSLKKENTIRAGSPTSDARKEVSASKKEDTIKAAQQASAEKDFSLQARGYHQGSPTSVSQRPAMSQLRQKMTYASGGEEETS